MRIGTANLILVAGAAVAAGQQPFPDPPPVVMSPTVLPALAPPPAAVTPILVPPPLTDIPRPATPPPLTIAETILTSSTAVGQQHTVGIQAQFGLPTGLRVQYAVYHGGDFSLVLEAFGGSRAAFWGDRAVTGVGSRLLFNVLSDGVKNALVVGPGVGVSYWESHDRPVLFIDPTTGGGYLWRGETDRYFLNLDTNVGWLHEISPALGWELGINLGVRIGLSGHEREHRDESGRVSGLTAGVYTGLRY